MANHIGSKEIHLEIITYGSFGEVYKAKWQHKRFVAKRLNFLSICDVDKSSLLQIRHKNIIRIYGTADEYLLMEYADCGSLHEYLHGDDQREYTVMDALYWMYQAALGLAYLRYLLRVDENFVYRSLNTNLNTNGLMLSNNFRCLKISFFPNTKAYPLLANEYLSPEAIKGEEDFTGKCDVYSLGIIFWEVLTRKKPFYHTSYTSFTLGGAIIRGARPSISDIKFLNYDPIKKLIVTCWQSNPANRNAVQDVACTMSKTITVCPTHVLGADIGAIVDSKDIKICKKIGEGSFGITYRAVWLYKNIAVKKIKNSTDELVINHPCKKHVRKLLLRQSLKFHEHVVKIYGIFMYKDSTYLLSDYSECGSLSNYLHGVEHRKYSVDDALDWMYQAAEGIKYLVRLKTQSPIIHYNIKPQNMLFFQNFARLKISDYCSPVDDSKLVEYNLDIAYLAPEVFNEVKFTKESAIYSFGIIFWEVMCRKKPFHQFKDIPGYELMIKIENGERPATGDIRESRFNFIEETITNCWNQDPAKRPALTDLLFNSKTLNKVVIESYEPPTVDFSDLTLLQVVGQGSFGVVYKAFWFDKEIALKRCNGISILTEDPAMKNFKKEVAQLSRVDHENIVQLFGITFDSESAYLLMEFAECGSLSKLLHGKEQRPYTMADAIYWMIQCVNGIQHLHGMKPKPLLHRDLKPDNLLLTDKFHTLKIGDFGTVTELSASMTQACGTPDYIAPEVILGKKYTEKCDIFSFGIILWEVMSRKKPFRHMENPNRDAIMYSILNGDRPQLSDITVPNCSQLTEIIQKCWEHNPDKRPSVEQILLSDIPCTQTQINNRKV